MPVLRPIVRNTDAHDQCGITFPRADCSWRPQYCQSDNSGPPIHQSQTVSPGPVKFGTFNRLPDPAGQVPGAINVGFEFNHLATARASMASKALKCANLGTEAG